MKIINLLIAFSVVLFQVALAGEQKIATSKKVEVANEENNTTKLSFKENDEQLEFIGKHEEISFFKYNTNKKKETGEHYAIIIKMNDKTVFGIRPSKDKDHIGMGIHNYKSGELDFLIFPEKRIIAVKTDQPWTILGKGENWTILEEDN